ncbi:Ig-like domain-containing protein [Marinoscillum sp. 108]|uniref:Ig-like domain-containing protein n=1 Tax=Marinoscillum sp. 108 TaxID=2653151 RepID=UPI0012EFF55C|nr:Ig-like domain-containing protein [Marinoscillum sp. 108]VXD11871.1 conserved hypothetical protein [Marinoscillum sp. 108]
MRYREMYLLCLLSLASCIGTDFIDDPKDAAILTEVTSISLKVGETVQIEATYYYNMWVAKEDAELIWQSNDRSVASVDQSGKVTAVGKGQTKIQISYANEETVTVDVTVVENTDDVARVQITAPGSSLMINETIQLTARAFTMDDVEVTDKPVIWTSSNETLATVNSSGLVTAHANGIVSITAEIEDVKSPPFQLMIGTQARSGVFEGSGSYKAVGTVTLFIDDNDQLILTFSADFETSFALGTFVYLANSTSGTVVRSQGLEIAEVTTNGAKTYNVSLVNSSVGLNDYNYVILLCKPASITFGSAALN